MILRKEVFLFAVAVFSAFLLSGCFDASYEPATIKFTGPESGQVFPAGTEVVTIKGKVNRGSSRIAGLRVENGGTSVPVEDFNKTTGRFTYEFAVDPIPADRHFKASTCTFKVIDARMKVNHERLTVVLARSYVSHVFKLDGVIPQKNIYLTTVDENGIVDTSEIDDTVILDNATASISVTEDLIEEVVPYLTGLITDMLREMLPDLIDRMKTLVFDEIKKYTNISMDQIIDIKIDQIFIGDVAVDVDFIDGDRIKGSFSLLPHASGSRALGATGYFSVLNMPSIDFDVSLQSVNIDNLDLNLIVTPDYKVGIKLDMREFDLSIEDPDFVMFGIDFLNNLLTDAVADIMVKVLNSVNIEEMPIVDVSALALNLPRIDAAMDFPETPGAILKTNDDAMRTNLGVYLDYTEWRTWVTPREDTFVFTPGDPLPYIMADPDSGESDMVAAVSDDLFNQATSFMVQSGFLETILDIVDIDLILKAIAPNIYETSPDLDISVFVTTPPLADFSTDTEASTDSFGRFSINNLIVEIRNLMLNGEPQTFRFSIDANNLGLRLNFDFDDQGEPIIIAGADFKLEDLGFTVLYMSIPGTEFVNTASNLALGIGERIIKRVIPLTFKLKIPEQEFPLPSIQFTNNMLKDNYLIITMGADFPAI